MSGRSQEVRRPRHPPEMRCIIRQLGENGEPVWRVAISRPNPRRVFSKYFTDAAYGSTEAALAAAQRWRDEIEAQYPRTTKRDLATLLRKHNTTGVPGVYRRVMRRKRKGGGFRTHIVWQAQTPLSLRPYRSRSFSILKYGEEEAKRLAVEARKEFEAELELMSPSR